MAISIDIFVPDQETNGFAKRDIGNDIQGEVLRNSSKIHWFYIATHRNMFLVYQLHEVQNAVVDAFLQVRVFLSRVL